MKKKVLSIVLIVLLVVAVIGVMLSGGINENVTTFWFTEEIVVENGVADSTENVIPFTLKNDGTYVVYTKWAPQKQGLISALVLRNEAGEILFFTSGEAVEAESWDKEMKAGEYKAQFLYFTNDADLEQILKETDAVSYGDGEEYAYAENETFEITYHFKIERTDGVNVIILAGILIGCLVGIILVLIVMKVVSTDGSMKAKYDERQQLARGEGFKYGFFTHLIYDVILYMLLLVGVRFPAEEEVLLFLGILLGLVVWVIYCIRKEAYVSLNKNAFRLMITFTVLGVVNLFIGVITCLSGELIVDGVLTFRCINIICGVSLLLIAVFLGINAAKSKQEED